jgi:hypothetical protein
MKQKDIALILVMVSISAMVALVISKLVFSAPGNREQTAEVVDEITPEFPTPPTKYFNIKSVDPAQPISIGTNDNQ